jgi:hypothetical protein
MSNSKQTVVVFGVTGQQGSFFFFFFCFVCLFVKHRNAYDFYVIVSGNRENFFEKSCDKKRASRNLCFLICLQKGGWAAKEFKAAGYYVVGVTRSGKSIPSCDKVVTAELTSADSVAAACAGADLVFGLTQPWLKNGSVDEELEKKQAEGLARGCAKAKVGHLIYTSVISSSRWIRDDELGG